MAGERMRIPQPTRDVPQGKLFGLAEYSRHYSAESEYLRRQNMNSK